MLLVTSRLLLKENVPRPDVPEKMESAPFLKQICHFCAIVPLSSISILWTAESLRRVERILSFRRCQFLCHIRASSFESRRQSQVCDDVEAVTRVYPRVGPVLRKAKTQGRDLERSQKTFLGSGHQGQSCILINYECLQYIIAIPARPIIFVNRCS